MLGVTGPTGPVSFWVSVEACIVKHRWVEHGLVASFLSTSMSYTYWVSDVMYILFTSDTFSWSLFDWGKQGCLYLQVLSALFFLFINSMRNTRIVFKKGSPMYNKIAYVSVITRVCACVYAEVCVCARRCVWVCVCVCVCAYNYRLIHKKCTFWTFL